MKFVNGNSAVKQEMLERFIAYVKTYTTSDAGRADQRIQPSTDRQFDLAKIIASEMNAMGLSDVQITEHCYVYGFLSPSYGAEKAEPVCLIAHMDTAGEVTGENVKPNIIEKYDGSVIRLQCNVTLDHSQDKALLQAAKEKDTIITTDGTTLLGADDKAGIAEIMSAVSFLIKNPQIRHGKIEIIFSPDEETGHGTDDFPFKLLSSKRA